MTHQVNPFFLRRMFPLLALIILFAGPIFLAVYFYKHPHHLTGKGTQHGTLITPPVDIHPIVSSWLPPLSPSSEGSWRLLVLFPAPCTERCIDWLYMLRQVKIGLGKKTDRMIPYFVTLPTDATSPLLPYLQKVFPSITYATIPLASFNGFLQQLPPSAQPTPQGILYVVDPKNKVILSYGDNMTPDFVLKDLNRLIRN